MVLVRLLRTVAHRITKLRTDIQARQLRTLAGVITSVGTFVIFLVALMQVLSLLGFNLGSLLATAGIAGWAIGFGAQTRWTT